MAGSRGHRPHADVQESRSGLDCLVKAAQGGSHPAGGPSPLSSDPVGSEMESKTGPAIPLLIWMARSPLGVKEVRLFPSVQQGAGERVALPGMGRLPEGEGELSFHHSMGGRAMLLPGQGWLLLFVLQKEDHAELCPGGPREHLGFGVGREPQHSQLLEAAGRRALASAVSVLKP